MRICVRGIIYRTRRIRCPLPASARLFRKGWREGDLCLDKSHSSLRGRAPDVGTRHTTATPAGTQRRVGIVYCAGSINPRPSPISPRGLVRSAIARRASATWSTNVSQSEKLCHGSQITCRINARASPFARWRPWQHELRIIALRANALRARKYDLSM